MSSTDITSFVQDEQFKDPFIVPQNRRKNTNIEYNKAVIERRESMASKELNNSVQWKPKNTGFEAEIKPIHRGMKQIDLSSSIF